MSLPRRMTFECQACGEPALTVCPEATTFVECPHCGQAHLIYYNDASGKVDITLERVEPCDDCGDYRPADELVGGRCPSCAREEWRAA